MQPTTRCVLALGDYTTLPWLLAASDVVPCDTLGLAPAPQSLLRRVPRF